MPLALAQHPPLHPRNLRRSLEAHVPMKALRDLANRLRYGPEAPLSDECLWIRPRDIRHNYRADPASGAAPHFRRHQSGSVVGGEWDRSHGPVGGHIKYRACTAHFRDGVPWGMTGLFDYLLERIARHGNFDELRTMDDITRRYAALDAVADEARRAGRLKARSELARDYFRREHGGVLVHVARDGSLLRAGGGQHRFALAQALDLDLMPVQLGVIHPRALESGVLAKLREPPADYAPI